MPSLPERVPFPLPRHGQLERLAIARRLAQPEHVAPDPGEPYPVANDRSAFDPDPAWPPDDAVSSEGARSALSAPANFIAEGPVKALFHRHFGRGRWPVVLAPFVIAAAAAAYVGFDSPAPFPQSAIVAKDAPRGSADLSGRPAIPSGVVPSAEANTAGAASAPQPPRDPVVNPVVTTTGSAFQRRLATAGLPDPDANVIGTTDAPVTAFPPNAAVEPESPSGVPPSPEPPVAETHESAAVEVSQAKALPPPPNPKLDALVTRAEQLLAAGDVTKARQFFARIAADGDPRGALGMARSYDEQILRTLPVGGLAANPAQSKWWYEKAQSLGAAEQQDHGGRINAAR